MLARFCVSFTRSSLPLLDVDFHDRIGASASNVRCGGMKSDAMDGLVVFLSVRCDLLDATFRLQIPQSQRAVMALKMI